MASPNTAEPSLQKWDTLSADEKKLFIRQADVFAAYTAYTDHEIGRVIQAVEDMGKLDNTLIIYISGDNGTQRRRIHPRYPERYGRDSRRQHSSRGAVEVLRRLGFGRDHAAHGGGVGVGLRHAVQMD